MNMVFWINKDFKVLLHLTLSQKKKGFEVCSPFCQRWWGQRGQWVEAGSERAGETPVQEKSKLLIIVNHTHPQAPRHWQCVLHLYKYTLFIQVFKFTVNNSQKDAQTYNTLSVVTIIRMIPWELEGFLHPGRYPQQRGRWWGQHLNAERKSVWRRREKEMRERWRWRGGKDKEE